MTDNIEEFPGTTLLDIEPSTILSAALKADLSTSIVIGINENEELYFASSTGNMANILYYLELAKKELLDFA